MTVQAYEDDTTLYYDALVRMQMHTHEAFDS